jgi:hypothetical protein
LLGSSPAAAFSAAENAAMKTDLDLEHMLGCRNHDLLQCLVLGQAAVAALAPIGEDDLRVVRIRCTMDDLEAVRQNASDKEPDGPGSQCQMECPYDGLEGTGGTAGPFPPARALLATSQTHVARKIETRGDLCKHDVGDHPVKNLGQQALGVPGIGLEQPLCNQLFQDGIPEELETLVMGTVRVLGRVGGMGHGLFQKPDVGIERKRQVCKQVL